ncbi:MAG: prepilin peptidase [Clostridium sp.]|nr:prepilin peptidase [Clostridium sp.]
MLSMVCILILGICIGSFLNVCIYRIPKENSIIYPNSHCINCGYKLRVIDLIPLLSYIFLKGRCRKCKERISIRYIIVEMLNGILYLLIYLKFGFNVNSIFYCLLASLLIVISFIDLETKYIYTSTTIIGVIIGIVYICTSYFVSNSNIIYSLLGGMIGFSIIYLIVIITKAMGEGDAEIAGICGLFVGFQGIITTLFIAIVSAGIIASILLILKIKDKKSEIAFGPYISLGAILFILIGENIYFI